MAIEARREANDEGEAEEESEEAMPAKATRTQVLSMIIGGAIGYVAEHYLTGANGASHGLVGLVIGGFTPLLVSWFLFSGIRSSDTDVGPRNN